MSPPVPKIDPEHELKRAALFKVGMVLADAGIPSGPRGAEPTTLHMPSALAGTGMPLAFGTHAEYGIKRLIDSAKDAANQSPNEPANPANRKMFPTPGFAAGAAKHPIVH